MQNAALHSESTQDNFMPANVMPTLHNYIYHHPPALEQCERKWQRPHFNMTRHVLAAHALLTLVMRRTAPQTHFSLYIATLSGRNQPVRNQFISRPLLDMCPITLRLIEWFEKLTKCPVCKICARYQQRQATPSLTSQTWVHKSAAT